MLRRILDSGWTYLLAGALLLGILATSVFDSLQTASQPEDGGEPGRWRRLRPDRVDASLTELQRDTIEKLEAIGYASGSTAAPERDGITAHLEPRAYAGLNFFTSGHAPEATLMDMAGNVLHRWSYRFRDVWPDYPEEWLQDREDAEFWRRAQLLPNGDVVAIFEGLGIIKVDRDSKLLWSNPVAAHHDLEVLPDGRIYVLARRAHLVPRIDPEEPVLEDFISILDADGNETRRISLLRAFERSEFNDYWDPDDRIPPGDLFHTNTLALLDGRIAERVPAFARGNLLISLYVPDVIAVVDPRQEKVVWAAKGGFRDQHDPKILENGNLLLFDNLGADDHSRVLELDPAAPQEISWVYGGDGDAPFLSPTCGTAERLPNGNTLVVESDGGRAFEVTPDKQTVWEFVSPHRAGPEGDLIATLFDVVRLPPDFPTHWTQPPEGEAHAGREP